MRQAEGFCSNHFELIKLVGLTMAETRLRLSELPPDTMVFYDDIRADVSGPILPWTAAEDLSSFQKRRCSVAPDLISELALWGGMSINRSMLNPEIAGQIAAVIRVGNADSVPIARDQSSRFVFDWRQLEKYRLSATDSAQQ